MIAYTLLITIGLFIGFFVGSIFVFKLLVRGFRKVKSFFQTASADWKKPKPNIIRKKPASIRRNIMQHQNPSKKAIFLIIAGIIVTVFGIVLRKKPESVEAFKAKIAKRFGGS